ncbi:hypothetical protein GCM10027411_22980 [Microbacterium aureliae]
MLRQTGRRGAERAPQSRAHDHAVERYGDDVTAPDTAPPAPERVPLSRPIIAGVVTALVGVTSSFAVVLTGLAAVGASPAQAASGLLALCVTMGLASLVLSWRL